MRFYYETELDREYGDIVILRSVEPESGKEQKVYLAPDNGYNLVKYEAGGEDLIFTDPEILRNEGFSGIPILYPTPNRIKDAGFSFKGQCCQFEKNGGPRYLHGLVYDEQWTAGEPEFTEYGVKSHAWVAFDENSILYRCFPWKHRLEVSWELRENGVRLEYEVHNLDSKELPFGFAIHPYFPVHAFGETAQIQIPAKLVYESTPDRFPTGKLLKTADTRFSLNEIRKVTELSLDDVYTGVSKEEAEILYGSHRIVLAASEEFRNMVVYTPEGEEFFCLENQTCMTDAHNFYDNGYENTGLLIVSPYGAYRGWIELTAFV